ncbi:MAG: hypothetical protein HQM09_16130 [Candidatus Riflebacteria bacterium]|nr:hypothetical protein [Candidatus Riflebacteria bacterium]
MIDLKDFLKEHNMVIDAEHRAALETLRIMESRNQLLATARGSLREHLQQQLIAAIKRFNEEPLPTDPTHIS